MRNILITGGSGFIGRNLIEGFQKESYNVFAPTHNELDILDYDVFEDYVINNNISHIIHSAIHVPIFNGFEKEFFNDMQMFTNIERVSHNVDKVIYFGSGAEYDKRYNISSVSEDEIGKHIPNSEYGLAKYTMNLIARKSENIFNLRLFGVFGKYELWNLKFLSNLCCKAVFDFPLSIRKDCLFDFLYIDDLVNIVSWFINHTPRYHDYNVCSGKPFALTELAKIVRDVSAKNNLPIITFSAEYDLDYTANNSRLCKEIPMFNPTPMDVAIGELYHYYIQNKEMISYDILKDSR